MYLCSSNHDEVCYENPDCPVCTIRDDLQDQLESANKDIKELEKQLEGFQNVD